MNQNLANILLNDTNFLNIDNMYKNESKYIINFFLNKNIEILLGKTFFNINQEENKELMIDKVIGNPNSTDEINKHNKLNIDYLTNNYFLTAKDDMIILKKYNTDNEMACISYDSETNSYIDEITYFEDNSYIKEVRKVTLNSPMLFKYKKEIGLDGNIQSYPEIYMVHIGKIYPNKDTFEIKTSVDQKNTSIIKNIIDGIRNNSLIDIRTGEGEIVEYLPEIYDVIESKEEEFINAKNYKQL